MNKLEVKIPEGVEITPELKKRCQLAVLPQIAENYALTICEKRFGKKFKLAPKNQKGYDVISECKNIKVEVKQTSCLGTKTCLSIGSIWGKKDNNTHIMIFDFYNKSSRISIMPANEFYNSDFHGKVKLWRWSKDYNKNNMSKNTNLFLHHEFKK